MTRPKSRPTTLTPLSTTSEPRDRAELRTADDEMMAAHIRGRYSSPVGLGALSSLSNGRVGRHYSVSTMPSENTARMGDEGKAVGPSADGFAVFGRRHRIKKDADSDTHHI
jgi:hypothetical protein